MSLPKYWLNNDEFIKEFGDKLEPEIRDKIRKKLNYFNNSEELLREIENLLPESYFIKLKNKIRDFLNRKCGGEQHVDGIRADIPPIQGDFDVVWKAKDKIALTNIQVETTGWKPFDSYSLEVIHYLKSANKITTNVKKKTLFDHVPFKELGEHKAFSVFYNYFAKGIDKFKKDDELHFILHNNSGNSRQLYLDIEYLLIGKGAIAGGTTALFLDVSGSMWNVLNNMSTLMNNFLINLDDYNRVTICFVAGIGNEYAKGKYDYIRHDFKNKTDAIKFMTNTNNIPHVGGGDFDIVTVKSAIDYKMDNFDNYVFCTDQRLYMIPNPDKFKASVETFFKDKDVYTIPTDLNNKEYWEQVYKDIELFRPLN